MPRRTVSTSATPRTWWSIDTQTNKVVGDIPDTPGVHGVAIAADLGRGFVSNGRENKSSIFDLKTLKLIQKVDTGENPDWILYEPSKKEVYTMNGRGKSATVFDATSGKVVATIPLEGKPETAQADSKAGKIYVNMEDLNSVKVIDIATHKVTATWPAAPCEAATGMAFDVASAPPVPRLRQQADGDDGQHRTARWSTACRSAKAWTQPGSTRGPSSRSPRTAAPAR